MGGPENITEDISSGQDAEDFGVCPLKQQVLDLGIYPVTHRPLDVRVSQPTSEFSPVFWVTPSEEQFISQGSFGMTTYLDIFAEDILNEKWVADGLWVNLGLTTFAEDATIVLCFNFDADPIPDLVQNGHYGPMNDTALPSFCDFCWPERDCAPSTLSGTTKMHMHVCFCKRPM